MMENINYKIIDCKQNLSNHEINAYTTYTKQKNTIKCIASLLPKNLSDKLNVLINSLLCYTIFS